LQRQMCEKETRKTNSIINNKSNLKLKQNEKDEQNVRSPQG